jgi:hypothetical protein
MAKEKEVMGNCNDESGLKMEDCRLRQFERNKYFYGKLMTVSDFQLEQSYLNEKRHLLNRLIHGIGVVCGLEVEGVEKTSEECSCGPEGEITMVGARWVAHLSAGTALDCTGREIVVSRSGRHFISEEKAPESLRTYFGLYIRRKDALKTSVPSPANTSSCDETCCYSHIQENFELVFDELPQVVKLSFDSSTYSTDDIATIFLVEPDGNEEPGDNGEQANKRDVFLTSSVTSEPLRLTLDKVVSLPQNELPGASIFSGFIRLKKSEPRATEETPKSSRSATRTTTPRGSYSTTNTRGNNNNNTTTNNVDATDTASKVGEVASPIIPPALISRPRRPVRGSLIPNLPGDGGEGEPEIPELDVASDDEIVVKYPFSQEQTFESRAYVRDEIRPKIEKKRIADDYYRIWLKECACCDDVDDPKVLLTVLDRRSGEPKAETAATAWYRSIVYNNPMLYDLISCHLVDKNNPHEVTAEQVGALKRIIVGQDVVGNAEGSQSYHPEITFKAGEGIAIKPEDKANGEYKSIKFEATAAAGFSTSGIISEVELIIPPRDFVLLGPFRHHASSEDGTPPSIVLGAILPPGVEVPTETIHYMEDPIFWFFLSRRRRMLQKSLRVAQRFFPLFFKAVLIDNEKFGVVITNPNDTQVRFTPIRWWAHRARTVTEEEPDNDDLVPRNVLEISSVELKDSISGRNLKTLSVGKRAKISTTLKNNKDERQRFSARVNILDKNGNVIKSQKKGSTLAPSSETTLRTEWIPYKEGRYSLKIDILDPKKKTKLTPPKEITINVK